MGNGERCVWGESAGKTELIRFGEVHGILDGYEKVVQENVSMLIGMGVFVLVNYFGQRWIVFKKQ